MGVFDSVTVKCPRCNSENEEQYKSGNMDYYSFPKDIEIIPYNIITDLQNKRWECYKCKKAFFTNIDIYLKIENPTISTEYGIKC